MHSEVSEREAEVLAAVGARLTNAQIANRLHISVRTVESHISSLLRKYGVTDRRALAEQAEYGGPPAGRLVGLPASRTTFVGRSRERDLVLGLLADMRLVTLLGPGGIGMTRLAAVVAEAAGRVVSAGRGVRRPGAGARRVHRAGGGRCPRRHRTPGPGPGGRHRPAARPWQVVARPGQL